MTLKFERRAAVHGREHRSFALLDLKATGDSGIVEGYGSVFGVKDSYDDVILPGAFSASLAAQRAANTMPAMLWQHDPSEPIGIWSEMVEDERGLRVKGQLALETVRGREAFSLLKLGALNGLSIGFVATAKSYNDRDGTRMISAIDLWEVSLVTFPANGSARVDGIKSADGVGALEKPSDAERWLREAAPDMSKSVATAFVSRLMRMGEERREAAQSTAAAQSAADRLLSSLTSKD